MSGHHHAYYPGRRGSLRLVSMACLGGGARPLIGERDPSARSILAFEITDDGVRELEGLHGACLRAADRAREPAAARRAADMRIVRDDLPAAPFDLTSR
ncbi:MAG: hypothetical protein M5U28_10000 [Sandaracinaceae bacterium]|nr:hypothetical protein [Sandaracinaceae bacterium]